MTPPQVARSIVSACESVNDSSPSCRLERGTPAGRQNMFELTRRVSGWARGGLSRREILRELRRKVRVGSARRRHP